MPYTKKRYRSKNLKKYKKSNRLKPKYGKRKNSLKKNNKKRSKSRSNKRTRSRSKSKTNKRSIKRSRSRSRSRSRKNRHKGGSKCLQKQTDGKCNLCNQRGGKCKNCNQHSCKCNQCGGKCKNCNKCNQHGGKCKNCNQHGCKCNQCGEKCNLCNQLGGDDVDDINKLLGLASVKTKQEQRSRSRNPPKRLINEKNEKVIKIPRKKLSSKEKGKGIAKNRAQMKVDVKKIINKEIDSHIKDCKVYKKCDNNFKYNKKLGFGTCPDDNCYYINKTNAENLGLDTYGCYKCDDHEAATNQLALDLGLLSF